MPLIMMTVAATAETANIAPGGVPPPSSDHRKPSTTPTIGFSPYSAWKKGSLIRLDGYAIGVANIQNCRMNGTTYRMSRYCTLSAESHSPTPSAVTSASSKQMGSHRIEINDGKIVK